MLDFETKKFLTELFDQQKRELKNLIEDYQKVNKIAESITMKQACELTGMSRKTIKKMLDRGMIKGNQLQKNSSIFIELESIKPFLKL